MTSKNLFFKLIKQNLKKRIWYPLIVFISFFIVLEVVMLMTLEDIIKFPKSYSYDIITYVNNYFFGRNNSVIAIFVCIAAFLCAFSGFAYLHSKVQLDTYHSLPVKRTILFWSNYISGILQFIIPFSIHSFICMAIAIGKNATDKNTLSMMFEFIGIELLVFILAYSITIIAVELTGNIIISILGTAVLFSYSMIISVLIYILFSRFYNTFVNYNTPMSQMIWGFSPLSVIYKLFEKNNLSYVWIAVTAAAVYSIIAYILYLKRESEAAGKAIAFKLAEPIIKTGVVIPASFFCGLFFADVSTTGDSEKWLIFGLIFGFVIICLMLEIIFRMDIRAIFKHKGQFIINAMCTALIFIVLKNDVLGYDTYVPSDTQLKSCAVSIEGLMNIAVPIDGEFVYSDSNIYRMNKMEIQGNPSVMELARKAAKEGLEYKKIYYYDGIEETKEYMEIREKEESYRQISFGYKLLNGKVIYRRYIIDIEDKDTYKLLSDIFNDYDYKVGSMPILDSGWNTNYAVVICQNNWTEKSISLKDNMQSKLLEAFCSEYTKLTFDDITNTIPLGSIRFRDSDKYRYSYYRDGILIYPQFKETIRLLKEYGFDMEMKLNADDVVSISIENRKAYMEAEEDASAMTEDVATAEVVNMNDFTTIYTDKNQIQHILDSIVCDENMWQVDSYTDFYNTDFYITIETDISINSSYWFINNKRPEFVN